MIMKILATGDLHGDTRLAEKLAKTAQDENVDLVIIAGDITNFHGSTDNLIGHFKKRNQKVLIIPGNHESFSTTDFLSDLYEVKNIHGSGVKYDDVGIFGCGGANIGLEPMHDDEFFNTLDKGHKDIAYLKKKIMVTHVHPTGTHMEKMTNIFKGSHGIRRAVDDFQPDILICCHVHEAAGIEEKIGNTKVLNVSKQAKIINL